MDEDLPCHNLYGSFIRPEPLAEALIVNQPDLARYLAAAYQQGGCWRVEGWSPGRPIVRKLRLLGLVEAEGHEASRLRELEEYGQEVENPYARRGQGYFLTGYGIQTMRYVKARMTVEPRRKAEQPESIPADC